MKKKRREEKRRRWRRVEEDARNDKRVRKFVNIARGRVAKSLWGTVCLWPQNTFRLNEYGKLIECVFSAEKEERKKKTEVELTVSTMQCITSFCIDADYRAAVWYETVDGLSR